jgi:hypothetical protein
MDSEQLLSRIASFNPILRSNADAIALFVHFFFLNASDLRLVALSEDSKQDTCYADIPEGWNANQDVYCFKYKNASNMHSVLVKIVPLGNSVYIHACMDRSTDVHSAEIK